MQEALDRFLDKGVAAEAVARDWLMRGGYFVRTHGLWFVFGFAIVVFRILADRGVLESDNAIVLLTALGTGLLVWGISREDRIAARRPMVLVDIDERPDRGLHDKEPAHQLNIRNAGEVAAVDIRITFSAPPLTSRGEFVSNNPVVRDGIPYLGPKKRLSILLRENHSLMAYIDAQIPYHEGEQPPPPMSPTMTVRCVYRDLVTRREYREEYRVSLVPEIYGWTLADNP